MKKQIILITGASSGIGAAAIRSLIRSLRVECAKDNIRLCNVAPAKIKTPMMLAAKLSEDELIQVEEFAQMLLWIFQQPEHICIRDIELGPTQYAQ